MLLVAAACLALAWRRRYPVAVLVVSAAAVSAYSLLGYVNGASLVAPVLALYAVATQVSVRQSVIAAVATLAVLLTVTAANNPFGHITGGGFDIIPFMVAAALFAGIAVANRQAYVASIQDRAEQDARRRVDEERLRIARELQATSSPTPWPPSTCRPGWPPTCCPPARRRRPSRCWRSRPRARTASGEALAPS